jgi:DNA-binding XRE family transcriptional regulator
MQTKKRTKAVPAERERYTLDDFIIEERKASPEFAAELDKLALARSIKELRESQKMTQAELATRAHTAQSAIARLESGKVVPRLDLLQKVANAMGRKLVITFG